jgi:hypothetical protein
MKKALMLVGLVLCAGAALASETRTDLTADGKKRNEEAYEKMLEQTGWKIGTSDRQDRQEPQHSRDHAADSSPSKSS